MDMDMREKDWEIWKFELPWKRYGGPKGLQGYWMTFDGMDE